MPRGVTLRTYMAVQVMDQTGCGIAEALEAVSTTWLDNPPAISLDEKRTWEEWSNYVREQEAQ